MIERNASLESSWSMKLISVGLDLNRGILSELEEVINSEQLNTNRCPQPQSFVNRQYVHI